MTLKASLVLFIGSPVRYPVPASASSCKYLFPSMSFWEMGPVMSVDTDSSGAYRFLLMLMKRYRRDLPMTHAAQDEFPSSAPFLRMYCMASGYSLANHSSLFLLE
eukprot:Plantae.Rhodophyta-Palmaria_palmata.ctg4117.p2 GENE.Plantae.Rhodophyta-Palmaria_palmata.ctg4117~~Plantae.Rhodophyta-Palmaria_palmata.ctg4117.p2  ORF type:complete len:105 (-),score=14.33 Plantae.Rhodophyta-Palmaria_palmata.ctg4117:116-430(-)